MEGDANPRSLEREIGQLQAQVRTLEIEQLDLRKKYAQHERALNRAAGIGLVVSSLIGLGAFFILNASRILKWLQGLS